MDLVVFVHVPKAAGTTVQRVIFDQYPARRILSFPRAGLADERLAGLPPERLDEIEVVVGHVDFGIHERFGRPARYMTMLRHPVARIVSHYRYVRSNPRHHLHQAVVEQELDLVAYAHGDLSEELRNGQVRMFSASASLDEAKRVLADEFAVVGLAERFDESLLLAQDALGWSTPFYTSMNRGTGTQPEVTQEAVAAIDAANRLDAQLWDFAAGLLAERMAATPGLAERVARFRRRNRVLGPVNRVVRAAERRLR